MELARPRSRRGRPRRGALTRPVNTRLLRNASVAVLGAAVVVLLSAIRTGSFPAPALPPAFDERSALRLTEELARDYPSRVSGSAAAERAAQWYRDRIALYGLTAVEDRWKAGIPGLGDVDLVNLATVIPGSSQEVIVVVAHRDNRAGTVGANDNASGTAALIELARGYAPAGAVGRRLEPNHTLVFLSSDGGAYGSLGAARFSKTSPLARRAVAVLSLDGLAGRAPPRVAIGSYVARSTSPALAGTVEARVREQTGGVLDRPGWLAQLVGLALPVGYGEQAPFLAEGAPAIRLTTAPDAGGGDDGIEELDQARLGQLGRSAEASLASLDDAIQLSRRTAVFVYVGDRVLRGWAVRLLLLAMILPFALVTVDLLVRSLRRGVRLAPTWRSLRTRVGLWLAVAGLVFVAAAVGQIPTGGPTPPVPDRPPLDRWPMAAAAIVGVVGVLLWLRPRLGRRPSPPPARGAGLGEYAAVFTALLLVALAIALVNTYALIFVLPSLYAWLWLPQLQERAGWMVDLVYGAGLLGPAIVLVSLAAQLDLAFRAPLYAVALATSGTTPWLLALCALCWAAVAGEIAGLVTRGWQAGGQGSRT